MFISRSEWEDMCDANRALLKDKAEKNELIEKLQLLLDEGSKKIVRLEEELKHKDNIIDIQKDRIEVGNKDYNIMLNSNQKLTDWVNKIINEVGIYEVKDRRSVAIPVYKNPVKAIGGNMEDVKDMLPNFLAQEEIIIPEIRFIRFK